MEGQWLTVVGQTTLMQGPLGVALSARREPLRPGPGAVESAIGSPSTNADHARSSPETTQQPKPKNSQSDQNFIEQVEPRTLFDASLIASALPPDVETRPIPAQTPVKPWQPPWSSFNLRDRTV